MCHSNRPILCHILRDNAKRIVQVRKVEFAQALWGSVYRRTDNGFTIEPYEFFKFNSCIICFNQLVDTQLSYVT